MGPETQAEEPELEPGGSPAASSDAPSTRDSPQRSVLTSPRVRAQKPPTWANLPHRNLSEQAFAAATTATDKLAWSTFRVECLKFPVATTLENIDRVLLRWKGKALNTRERYLNSLLKVLQYRAPRHWRISKGEAHLLRRRFLREKTQQTAQVRRAYPMTHKMLSKLMRSRQAIEVKMVVLLCWLTASRFDDVTRDTTELRNIQGYQCLYIPYSKADAVGVYKFLPKHVVLPLPSIPHVSYQLVLQALRSVDARLSAHSPRRGACTALADMGFSHAKIARLSGHMTLAKKAEKGLISYIEPRPRQPIPRMQRLLVSKLWTAEMQA